MALSPKFQKMDFNEKLSVQRTFLGAWTLYGNITPNLDHFVFFFLFPNEDAIKDSTVVKPVAIEK